jgi:DNA-directed RNA polymerase subunit M/transcription elongation factor TFIIS
MEDCPTCGNVLVPEWDEGGWFMFCYICKFKRDPTELEAREIKKIWGE